MNENLIKAAEYIDEHGWTKHKYEALDGSVCLYGAIIRVVNRNPDYNTVQKSPEAKHLNKYVLDKYSLEELPEIVEIDFDPVAILNDEILTSGAEASKVLREAAEWNPYE